MFLNFTIYKVKINGQSVNVPLYQMVVKWPCLQEINNPFCCAIWLCNTGVHLSCNNIFHQVALQTGCTVSPLMLTILKDLFIKYTQVWLDFSDARLHLRIKY